MLSAPPLAISAVQPQAIAAHDISMIFHAKSGDFQALKGVNLDIEQGTIQLLMGPAGAGKTTLLSILAGMLTPTAGQVYWFGQDTTTLSKSALAKFRQDHIGFVFQDFNLLRALTAIENIEIALELKGIHGPAAHYQARVLLEQVKLGDKADRLPRDLSGGQQQRVAIARALAGNPTLFMADEPTASLDSYTGRTITELICELATAHHSTVIIVTHDHRIADVADRITYLEDGQLSVDRCQVPDLPRLQS